MKLLWSVLALTSVVSSAAPNPASQQQDSGEYHVPCVKIDGDCANGTQEFDVFALQNYKSCQSLVTQLDSLTDVPSQLITYGVLNSGCNASQFEQPNTAKSELVQELLADNGYGDVDCSTLGNLTQICTAAQNTNPAVNTMIANEGMETANSYTISCSSSHVVDNVNDCWQLIYGIRYLEDVRQGSPRSIQVNSCYISWSQDAKFLTKYLFNAAYDMANTCAVNKKSGKAENTHLGEYTVTECLSDRATGCR